MREADAPTIPELERESQFEWRWASKSAVCGQYGPTFTAIEKAGHQTFKVVRGNVQDLGSSEEAIADLLMGHP